MDFRDAIRTVIQFVITTEHANPDGLCPFEIAAAAIGVTAVQLCDKFTDDEIEIIATYAVIDHHAVAFAHRGPVHAVHVFEVEVITEDAPGIVEHLGPFLVRIDIGGHARGFDVLALTTGRSLLHGGAATLDHQQLLAVASHVKGTALGNFFFFFLLVGDVIELDRRSVAARSGGATYENELVLVVDGKLSEHTAFYGELDGATLKAIEIDIDGLSGLLALAGLAIIVFIAASTGGGAGEVDVRAVAFVGRYGSRHGVAGESNLEGDNRALVDGDGEDQTA